MPSILSILRLAICLTSVAPLASASAWPGWLPDVDALVVRQDSGSSATETSSSASARRTSDSSISSGPSNDRTSSASATDRSTGDASRSGGDASRTDEATDSKSSVRKPATTDFAPDAPPGGVAILTPATSVEPTVLYKIKDYVTFGWNYTSLLGTPTAIDVLVSCSVASETWTLTTNMTFETSVNYVWDTRDQADSVQTPLLTQMYTLIVKDSDSEIRAPPRPGYLGTYMGFNFGLYTAKPYTPFAEWTCPGCNGASSTLIGHQAIGLAVTMSVLTFLSFTWFVAGVGLH